MPDAQVPNFPQDERITNVTGKNDVQTVKVDATSGNYTLEYGGIKTGNLAFNLTAAELKAKLELIAALQSNIKVTGGPGNAGGTTPYVVEFINDRANKAVEILVGASVSLAGGGAAVTVTHTVSGEGVPAKAVQVGTGLANRSAEVSPLEAASPAEKHAANSGNVYE